MVYTFFLCLPGQASRPPPVIARNCEECNDEAGRRQPTTSRAHGSLLPMPRREGGKDREAVLIQNNTNTTRNAGLLRSARNDEQSPHAICRDKMFPNNRPTQFAGTKNLRTIASRNLQEQKIYEQFPPAICGDKKSQNTTANRHCEGKARSNPYSETLDCFACGSQ